MSEAREKLLHALGSSSRADIAVVANRFLDYPLDVACCLAKFSLEAAEEQPTGRFEEYSTQFEEIVCGMLKQCNSEAETELILRQATSQRPGHGTSVRLLGDSRDLFEYAIADPPLVVVCSSPEFADYADGYWRRHQI